MAHRFCPGYVRRPFSRLVAEYPGEEVYPPEDFRTEWGPIFHRGRLDGTARVLVIGQDPATHETMSRRILVGEAGQRVQGCLARVGITSSYTMINTFLYSVYGQGGGARHAHDPVIAAYRHRWLDALLVDTDVTAVITFGTLADQAYRDWTDSQPAAAARLHQAVLRHPTYPESSSRSGRKTLAEATAELLANWSEQLPSLRDHVEPDQPTPLLGYGTAWQDGDLVAIPDQDLPAGCPAWMRSLDAWAVRTGDTPQKKRATITVTVPKAARTWPPSSDER
jgi:uracil-DNA glycosylase